MNEIAFSGVDNRREKQRDLVMQVVRLLSFFSIGLMVLLGLLIALAQPASYAVLDRRSDLGAAWDPGLCQILFGVMVVGVLVGVSGLVLNAKRLRRKYDFLRVNLMVLSIASLVGIVIYLIK